jgi:hypothetical protein
MWHAVKWLVVAFLVAGCWDGGLQESQESLYQRQQELRKEILEARAKADRERELLLTQTQERLERLALERAKSEREKEVELARIQMEQKLALAQLEQKYRLEELKLRQEQERLELENQRLIAQKELEVKKQFMIFSLIALMLILFAILIVLYFYKKRKDKLQAYHDNLEKYFKMKENEAKIAIANKIIDTIADGKLTPEQEQRLLGVLKGEGKELPKEIRSDEAIEAEIDDGKR